MKRLILPILVLLAPPVLSYAADSGPTSQPAAAAAATTTADLPTPAPVDKQAPESVDEGLGTAKDLIGAIKDRKWWLVSGLGIFLVMLILKLVGVFKKIGKKYSWWVVGGLSLAAGVFFAFDKGGFSWTIFFGYLTAGPTIAWLRDWIKKGMLGKGETTPLAKPKAEG